MIWDKYGYLTRVPGLATQARRLPYPIHSLDRVQQAVQTRVDVQVCLLRDILHMCYGDWGRGQWPAYYRKKINYYTNR